MRKILIASDHAGFKLKEFIIKHLSIKKLIIIDLGSFNLVKVDYPDYAHKLSKIINLNKKLIGILVCGSGIGMEMTANRYKNVRAALCYNEKTAKLARSHNNANIITLGSRLTKKKIVLKCINIFLNTKFKAGRHAKRINKI